MENFGRMQSDTGVDLVLICEDMEDGAIDMSVNYLNDIDTENNTGIVGDAIFNGIVPDRQSFCQVMFDIIKSMGFGYLNLWQNGPDKPPIKLSIINNDYLKVEM